MRTESVLSQNYVAGNQMPVPASEARVEGIGVNPLDLRRVDVAVDLTSCREPLTVKMAIVGPDDEEWSSTAILQNRDSMLDRVLHLKRDAIDGEYTLHVGLFREEDLLYRTSKRYVYPPLPTE